MAGLVPAIPIQEARSCLLNRDHRDTTLRVGPVMTADACKSYRLIGANFAGSMIEVFCSISRLDSSIFFT